MNYYVSTTLLEPVQVNIIYLEYEPDQEIYDIDLDELDTNNTNITEYATI